MKKGPGFTTGTELMVKNNYFKHLKVFIMFFTINSVPVVKSRPFFMLHFKNTYDKMQMNQKKKKGSI